MSRIDELITEHCPDGVECQTLDQVLRIRNGRDYKSFGPGNVPVYGTGGVMTHVDTAAYDGPSVLIPRKGSLDKLYFVDHPFWTVDTIFYTEIDNERIEPKFVFYILQIQNLKELNQAAGIPSLTQAVLNKLRIPVPPMAVQREIVRILDKMEKLQAELEARSQQYAHYRDSLLVFNDAVDLITLDTISVNHDSRRRPVSKSQRETGNVPYYGASGAVDYVNDYIFDGDFLLVSEDGANLLARSTPIAFSISGKSWVNNHAHVLEFETYAERRFAEIYLNSIDLSQFISGGAQPKLNQANLNRIRVPAPSLPEQQRIVSILDRFDTLVNNLSTGLPAEIEARRKQHEYYRDRLLTFKEAA